MEDAALQVDPEQTLLRTQRILIVGGGAIGQVFGLHLQEGGAEIAYFLKPRHAGEAEDGYDLHRYGLAGVRPRRNLRGFDVITDYRHLRARTFDQVWLCVSSPALRDDVIARIKDELPNALWVTFQPGVNDLQYLGWRLQTTKIVSGVVNFVAYQAPLKGEDLWPEGIAYFVPPMSMTPFTGPEPYASAVAELLRAGGLTAGVRPDTAEIARFGSSVLIPLVMALEAMDWSWSDLRASDQLLDLLASAVSEIQTAVEKGSGRTSGAFSLAQKRWAWKIGLFAAPAVAPFPLETYFRHHFSKVRVQSDQMVDELAQLCRDNAVIPRALQSLRGQWRDRRPQIDVDPAYKDPTTGLEDGDDTPDPDAPRGTGMIPAILPAPVVVDDEDEPLPIAPSAVPVLPAPAVAAIEDEVDLDSDVEADLESDVEEDSEPAAQPIQAPAKLPILRSLADLDQVAAIQGPDAEVTPPLKAPPTPARPALPFDVPEPAIAEVDSEEVSEPEVELPSIMVNLDALNEEPERPQMATLLDAGTVPADVKFQNAVPDELKDGLQREDFVQTELAGEGQNASLRDLKARLRSRLGSSQSMSPALKNDAEDP